jgi:hypothetical protein
MNGEVRDREKEILSLKYKTITPLNDSFFMRKNTSEIWCNLVFGKMNTSNWFLNPLCDYTR